LSDNQSAFIFPAFTSDYTDHPGKQIPGFEARFASLLKSAADAVDPSLAGFSFGGQSFLKDELRAQYLTYIYSCTASASLRALGFPPAMIAGYSMGIYASLYDAGSVSFEAGLQLIRLAYQSLMQAIRGGSYGMGSLIGLSGRDIHHLIDLANLRIEITNQNAPHSFVVSGFRDDLGKLMELAREEGALHTRDLEVSIPYHSGYLKEGAMRFAGEINHLEIKKPGNQMISLIDQTFLTSPSIIRQELINNLFYPLNWLRTQHAMLEHNISVFVECGASKGLVKNAKFMEGNFKFYSINSFPLKA
jgi:[acyl-carrier-protein] S-malonyltransferase